MQMNNVNYCNFLFSCLAASCSCFIVKVPWLEKCGRVIWKTCFAVWRVNLVWIRYWHEICRMRWDSFWYGSACFLNGFAIVLVHQVSHCCGFTPQFSWYCSCQKHMSKCSYSPSTSVKLCSAQRNCKKPQELHLRLSRPQFCSILNFITVQLEKVCLIWKDFQEKERTWQQVCKAAFKQTTRLLHKTQAGMLGSAQHRIWWKSKTAYTNTLH